jgi:hypothetical protein
LILYATIYHYTILISNIIIVIIYRKQTLEGTQANLIAETIDKEFTQKATKLSLPASVSLVVAKLVIPDVFLPLLEPKESGKTFNVSTSSSSAKTKKKESSFKNKMKMLKFLMEVLGRK